MWRTLVLIGLFGGTTVVCSSTEAAHAQSAQSRPAQATEVCTLKVSGMT